MQTCMQHSSARLCSSINEATMVYKGTGVFRRHPTIAEQGGQVRPAPGAVGELLSEITQPWPRTRYPTAGPNFWGTRAAVASEREMRGGRDDACGARIRAAHTFSLPAYIWSAGCPVSNSNAIIPSDHASSASCTAHAAIGTCRQQQEELL